MTANMRPGTLRAYAFGVFTGALMTATMTMCAAPAKADMPLDVVDVYAPIVCDVLSEHPSTDGLLGIGIALMGDGWTGYEAGQIMGQSVQNECPQFIPILRAFAARYGNQTAAIA